MKDFASGDSLQQSDGSPLSDVNHKINNSNNNLTPRQEARSLSPSWQDDCIIMILKDFYFTNGKYFLAI